MVYSFLDHTADVKFLAEEESLEKAFIESAKALKETICGDIKILNQIQKTIEIEGIDIKNLLYKFLEEFIVLLDTEEFIFSEIENLEIDKESFKLKARVTGDKAENYIFTNDVKAVTYNDMDIIENKEKNLWKITVVLDV